MASKAWLLLAVLAAAATLVAAQQTTPTIAFFTDTPGYAADTAPFGGGYFATSTWVISQVLKDRDIPFLFPSSEPADGYDSDASSGGFLTGVEVILFSIQGGARTLSPYEVNLFGTFVEEGGVLVWIANAYSLNSSFVWGWESPVSDKDFEKTEEAAEGPFAEHGPATLTRLDNMEAVSNWEGDGVVCHYADGKDCAVLSVSLGEGFVVYLGANFTSNEGEMIFPREEERDLVTEDWEEVLALAVLKFVAGAEESESQASESQTSESSESESSAAVKLLPALSLFA
ncbi:hypothetical protein QOT17_017866 [Balamuthia mandrillaris]